MSDDLVPATPTAVTVCRYAGMDEGKIAPVLDRAATLGPRDAAQIAAALNAGPVPTGTPGCLNGDGAVDVLNFAYPAVTTLSITVELNGCQMAFSGHAVRRATSQVLDLLNAAVGPDPFASQLH